MSQKSASSPRARARLPGWTAAELAQLLPGSRWLAKPGPDWHTGDIAILHEKATPPLPCLFVAIDADTWHRGSGNTGIYAGWDDTHTTLAQHASAYCGAIVQRPVAGLPADFPQLITDDSYQALHLLAEEARRRMNGRLVAITGTVGKTSTKAMLHGILAGSRTVVASRGNHNTRTGASVTLARAIGDPDAVVMEVALSALWMRNGGIGPRIKPHIVIVTEIGLTQVGKNVSTLQDVARFKSRISHGLIPGGVAILNRDMAEYQTVAAGVARDGARIISYGFDATAQVRIISMEPDGQGSVITLLFHQQTVRYRLAVPGKGGALNSVAALIAADLLGVSQAQVIAGLEAYRSDKQHMHITPLSLPDGGEITLIDDSYNAEYLSMRNAFGVVAERARDTGGRVVALLGRIVNLGDKADEIHRSLAAPLMETGCQQVFLHGEEMAALQGALPPARQGGHFLTAGALVDAAAPALRAGDIVLVKGSVRHSDFGQVVGLLKTRLATTPPSTSDTTARLLINLTTGEPRIAEQADSPFTPHYFSQLLLACCVAGRLVNKTVTLETAISVREIAPDILKGHPALGFQRAGTYPLKSLLQGMLLHNACDAAINLAEHLAGSSASALGLLRTQCASLNMTQTHVSNVSGRSRRGQHTTLKDVATLLRHFALRYPHFLPWFSESEAVIGERLYRKSGNLQSDGSAWGQFSAGSWGFALQWFAGELWLAGVAGASDAFHLDYLLDELLADVDAASPVSTVGPATRQLHKPAATLTFLGDTYFGEWYTRKRQARGIDDALQRYGYDHSFAAIAPLLRGSDITIANLEAALATDLSASLAGRKPFCLTGDPDATVTALVKQGISAVALGNNHVMDAGLPGLQQTLSALDKVGISCLGAGLNARQAHAPLVITVGGQTFKIYSAYWYREYMERDCAFYARARRPGVACLSGGLERLLREEKASEQPATTIVLAHWGVDYRRTTSAQRALAQRLTRAGADLIIGSGPHMPGEAVQLGQSLVVYSIGNAVFNSNGEFRERGAPPYGFIARLQVGAGTPQLQLLPIFTDNRQTFWQPRPVTEEEFTDLLAELTAQGMLLKKEGQTGEGWSARTVNNEHMLTLSLDTRFGKS
ncbi:CapA family protein [Yokenella regensburgei]|uniref:CapA family protein n=1 Tax=Yokenella regensburgei TaxID=158877 RepID=UPI003F180E6F